MNALQTHMIVLAAIAFSAAGCGSGTGSDTVSSPQGSGSRSTLGCTEKCHNSSNAGSPDPLVTNGTGTAGKHIRHVQERGIACERCHSGYANSPTHMNGTLDTRSQTVNVVTMDIVGPKGSWAPGTDQCSDVACHGASTMDWYGTTAWTTPACTICHSSAFSSVLDPAVTGGSGITGKHEKHVTSYNYTCSKCHLNYPTRTSHGNGVLDAENPSAILVWFDMTSPTGTWVNDIGPGTGACSSVSCHGAYSGTYTYYSIGGDGEPVENIVPYAGNGSTMPGWYSSTVLGCSDCHGNPPTVPNSTLKYAWHSGSHANNLVAGSNDCQLCHPSAVGPNGIGTAITDTTLHVNGTPNVQAQWNSNNCGCHF